MPPTKAPPTNRTAARTATRSRAPRPLPTSGGRRLTLGSRGQGLVSFLRDLRAEVRKVVWPTRRVVINLTAVVIAMAAALGAVLGLVDFIFQEFFRRLLQATGVGG